ncbi:MAG: pyridoxamine 5'-phosphate oxidase [Candidatus Dormiibacterota bacterium]
MSPPDLPEGAPPLHQSDLGDDPIAAFCDWLELAGGSAPGSADAMALATADPAGTPSVRMVLLRGVDHRGFCFHTNRLSRKGAELGSRPAAALLFHWDAPIHRQVRVEGTVERLEDAASDAYFQGRPPGARISAWASPQSRVVASRAALERRWERARARFPDDRAIPRPPHWGGYRVVPHTVEFWQGRADRLHDRILFRRAGEGWVRERLAP